MVDLISLGQGSVHGTSITAGSQRPPRTFPAGRRCDHAGCGTMLSVYNDTRYCSLHQSTMSAVIRGGSRRLIWVEAGGG